MDNLIDPLKIHTQGVKKPMEDKGEKLQSLADNNQRYYPTDPRGNLDEWGAVIRRQAEAFQRDQQIKTINNKVAAKAYGDELTAAMRLKQQEKDLEKHARQGDRDRILRAAAEKGASDQYAFDNHRAQQRMFGEAAQQLISQKNQNRSLERNNDRNVDQAMISMDNYRAQQIQNHQQQIKDQQRMILRDENLNLMSQKRNQKDLDRSMDLQPSNALPLHVGDGYQQQLQMMQEGERLKSIQMQQYSNNVGSPQRQKELQKEYDQAHQIQTNMQVQNQRAQLANDYHSRIKQEHKNQLQNQIQMTKDNKSSLMQAERNNDATQVQRMYQFNNQFEMQQNERRNRARDAYKNELDQQIKNRQALKAYGNMTNVEKEMNKDELVAWKKSDYNSYSMVPGVASSKRFADPRPQKHASPQQMSSKAAGIAVNEEKLRTQEERLAQYGVLPHGLHQNGRHEASTLRTSLEVKSNPVIHAAEIRGTPQPGKNFTTRANLNGNAMGLQQNADSRQYGSQAYVGPYNDSASFKQHQTIDPRSNGPLLVQEHARNSSLGASPQQQYEANLMQMQPTSIQVQNIANPAEGYRSRAGSRNSMQGPNHNPINSGQQVMVEMTPNKLKAQTNAANGGIGVSYSNVVLAGGLNPTEGPGQVSNYQAMIADGQRGQLSSNYTRGLDFNARQKYDYNILNGQGINQKSGRHSISGNPILQNAASRILLN